ncbi:hypothetical protein BU23DRAFT_550235 [Bimuria novae-zelandiae CBS 107.79]|uniref:Uncharacterized protein n=1 Tax=Bimuria novae-zelandiae CBS 107.79 TaxID=1447943 RepID=A0A6A5VKE1_9PLEO|nr:hypothetical protein BU23DRAFT_550235 [Bimuria novae-zelandiae CBS 107.79]
MSTWRHSRRDSSLLTGELACGSQAYSADESLEGNLDDSSYPYVLLLQTQVELLPLLLNDNKAPTLVIRSDDSCLRQNFGSTCPYVLYERKI